MLYIINYILIYLLKNVIIYNYKVVIFFWRWEIWEMKSYLSIDSYKKRFGIIIPIYLLIIITVSVLLFFYYTHVTNMLKNSAWTTLDEIAMQQQFNFASILQDKMAFVKKTVANFSDLEYGKSSDQVILRSLKRVQSETGFYKMALCNLNGQGINNDNDTLDVSQHDYFQLASKGNFVITEPTLSIVDGATSVIMFVTPVKDKEGEITGVFIASYKTSTLNELFLSSFGGAGYSYIINPKGDILAQTVNEYTTTVSGNLFDDYKKYEFIEYDSLNTIIKNIKAEKGGRAVYIARDGEKRFLRYEPITQNGWTLFSIVPEVVISRQANDISKVTSIISFIIVLAFSLLFIGVILLQRKNEKKLYKAAFYDELTGLPNRHEFRKLIQKILADNQDIQFAIAKLDVVQFKMINEFFGYQTGDMVIKAIAEVNSKVDSKFHVLGRIAVDEFLLFDTVDSMKNIFKNREQLESEVKKKIVDMGNHRIDFRYGIYYLDVGETDVEQAISKANLAYKTAKETKGLLICSYDDAFKNRMLKETEIENKRDKALANNEFKVYLQPKYEIINETIVGAEALVRWQNEDGKIISPGEFIPLFEQSGFITKLDMYMFEYCCKLLNEWKAQGLKILPISVNFSRRHLLDDNFTQNLKSITNKYDIEPHYLEVELTETVAMENEDVVQQFLEKLHEQGFLVSMDDFGTGYSSLGLLKNLDVDTVKMDRGFFINTIKEHRAYLVVSNMINMTKDLEIETVAEGVEEKNQVDMLRKLRCDIVQGYYFARPMPADDFRKLLEKN